MLLFAPRKEMEVQSFLLKFVNNHCPHLKGLADGPRVESRVNLPLVTMVIPVERKRAAVDRAFGAITKEFTTTGLSIILDHPRPLERVILGFRFEREMKYMLAEAKHLNPMGAGFYQLGLQCLSVVSPKQYPGIETVCY